MEILVASALSVIIIGTLLAALNNATNSYSSGSTRIATTGEARSAIDILRRDLAAACSGRDNDPGIAALGRLRGEQPGRGAPVTPSSSLPPIISQLSHRLILPFEINRIEGAIFDPDTENPTTATKSVANACTPPGSDDTYHPDYDALAFVTRAPLSRQSHTAINRTTHLQRQAPAADARLRSDGDACIAAYYVAYTKNADLPHAPASMKLFRHFRDSGSMRNVDSKGNRSQATAQHVLGAVLDRSRIPRLEGRLDNADLPMLLTPVRHYDNRDAIHPWPRFAADASGRIDYRSLPAPPPDELVEEGDISDPASEASLRADEPIAYNVIRFKVTPLALLTDPGNGGQFLAGSEEINNAYRLNRNNMSEWPVAIIPDLVRINLVIIDDETASLLKSRSDWEGWNQRKELKQLVTRQAREFETLIHIGGNAM